MADKNDDWGIPDAPLFHDLIVELEMETMGDLQLSEVLDWTNFWGGAGLFGLKSGKKELLRELRNIISSTLLGSTMFCTIPKDALKENKTELSVMLREDLRSVEVKNFTNMLFKKNKGLKGCLTLTKSKTFTDKDVTKAGQPMKGWRLLELRGDEDFLRSLAETPENQRFKLAGHFIFIRGGEQADSGPTGANATPVGSGGLPGPSGAGKGKGKGKNSGGKKSNGDQEENKKKEETTKGKEEEGATNSKQPRNSPDEKQGREDGDKGAQMEDE